MHKGERVQLYKIEIVSKHELCESLNPETVQKMDANGCKYYTDENYMSWDLPNFFLSENIFMLSESGKITD